MATRKKHETAPRDARTLTDALALIDGLRRDFDQVAQLFTLRDAQAANFRLSFDELQQFIAERVCESVNRTSALAAELAVRLAAHEQAIPSMRKVAVTLAAKAKRAAKKKARA